MEIPYPSLLPEIWGGLECTINRIGDTYRDQIEYAGHLERADDIRLIASLGIKKLRYPVLWENHEKSYGGPIDWTVTRRQLENIRMKSVVPVAGLVHHGSGPSFTDLTDPKFGEKLASYATRVAFEFPWLEYYTPVNEPLTTSRFSGLYGHWYPHHTRDASLCRIFINQIRGVVLSMQAIRKINPAAKLVQTEDLAKIHSTPLLAYQADFENHRSWLTYDFLCGKMNTDHPLWDYFIMHGISGSELDFFTENICPPDIAGFNYYITSERFLDHRKKKYPFSTWGKNHRHTYADIAAVRAGMLSGLESLLCTAWERYRLPMALTEVHMHCTREEQLRWFMEAWQICVKLSREGIDIRAVTAWSLLGAFDWISLLVREELHYESGVFDIRNKALRPTALTRLISTLAAGKKFDHPVLDNPGWWHHSAPAIQTNKAPGTRPVLILGCRGTLGNAFIRSCQNRSIDHIALGRQEADITDPVQIRRMIDQYKPWAVINASGYVRVDDAESEPDLCYSLNTLAPARLAGICNEYGIQLMTFSTDLVFDGNKRKPYEETDLVKPLNVYGRSKADGEDLVLEKFSDSLIIRTSSFFGPWDQYNFAFHLYHCLAAAREFRTVNDIIISPTYVPHLADVSLDLLIDEEKGIFHLTNEGHISWHDFAVELARRNGLPTHQIVACSQQEMRWKAERPCYSAMQSNRGIQLPPLEKAIEQYVNEKLF